MLADALAGTRIIGMTLLRAGWEHDYYGRPPVYEQGCAGRIEQHETLPDGRSNIVLRGLTRFRIVEEHAGEPYRLAAVVPLREAYGDEAEVDAAHRPMSTAGWARSSATIRVAEKGMGATPSIDSPMRMNTRISGIWIGYMSWFVIWMAGWLRRRAAAAATHSSVVVPKIGNRPRVMPRATLSAIFSGVCPWRRRAPSRAARARKYPVGGDGGSTSSIWLMGTGPDGS